MFGVHQIFTYLCTMMKQWWQRLGVLVVWGWLNFVIIVFSMQAQPAYDWAKQKLHIKDSNILWRIFQVIRTILLVSLLRIFYCSPSVGAAINYIRMMFTPNWSLLVTAPKKVMLTSLAQSGIALKYILAGTFAIFIVDLVKENEKKFRIPMPVRMIFWGLLFCVLIIGMERGSTGGFMYAQY